MKRNPERSYELGVYQHASPHESLGGWDILLVDQFHGIKKIGFVTDDNLPKAVALLLAESIVQHLNECDPRPE